MYKKNNTLVQRVLLVLVSPEKDSDLPFLEGPNFGNMPRGRNIWGKRGVSAIW